MTRFPYFAVLSLSFLTFTSPLAAEGVAPVTQSVEHPVSSPAFSAAAGAQQSPLIASNGELSLAVWLDQRSGDRADVYATRLDSDGRPLDPIGIVIAQGSSPVAVVWNGNEFAIFLGRNTGWELALVHTDGTPGARKTLAPTAGYSLLSATSNGGNARVLFVATSFTPAVLVLNGSGDVVAPAFLLPSLPGLRSQYVIGGAGESEFIVVRSTDIRGEPPATSKARSFADRISFEGQLLSSVETMLPVSLDRSAAVAGGRDGYALIQQPYLSKPIALYRLDGQGIYSGLNEALLPAFPNIRVMEYRPVIKRAGDHYLAAWHTSLTNGHSYTYAASIPAVGAPSRVKQMADWLGITVDVALAADDGDPHVITSVVKLGSPTATDVYDQRIATGLDAAPPELLTFSANVQNDATIAAGANGALVAWTEHGPDAFTRIMVRRVSPDGTPQDASPSEAARFPVDAQNAFFSPASRVTSNGETYLVAWNVGTVQGRRYSANTGKWLDEEPFTAGYGGGATFATNGRDVLAAWSANCPSGGGTCIQTRRIALTGDPLPAPVTTVTSNGSPYDLSLDSDGTDSLLAWSEGTRDCFILCALAPFKILAIRLRSDGTRIDSEPIVVEDAKTYAEKPSVAWTEDHHTIVWSIGETLRGARVTRDGSVQDRNPDGSGTTLQGNQAAGLEPHLFARGSELILVTRRTTLAPTAERSVVWELASLPAGSNLSDLAARPRVPIALSDSALSSLDLASTPAGLLVTYNRSDRAAGGVPRVVVRTLPDPSRRRAAAH